MLSWALGPSVLVGPLLPEKLEKVVFYDCVGMKTNKLRLHIKSVFDLKVLIFLTIFKEIIFEGR